MSQNVKKRSNHENLDAIRKLSIYNTPTPDKNDQTSDTNYKKLSLICTINSFMLLLLIAVILYLGWKEYVQRGNTKKYLKLTLKHQIGSK